MDSSSTPQQAGLQEACIKVLVASTGQVEQVVSQISCEVQTQVKDSYWNLGYGAIGMLILIIGIWQWREQRVQQSL